MILEILFSPQTKRSYSAKTHIRLWAALLLALLLCGCSDERTNSASGTGTSGDSSGFQAGCAPGSRRCDGNTVLVCAPDGMSFAAANECSNDLVCMQGACRTCEPGTPFCQGNQVAQCDTDGLVTVLDTCPDACAAGLCVTCIPGRRECRQSVFGGNEAWVCLATGPDSSDWSLQERCSPADDCSNGLCIGPCQDDVKIDTSQGCDYYAVDLENASRQADARAGTPAPPQFSVLAYNPSRDNPLSLSVFRTPTSLEPEKSISIPPRTLHVLELEPRQIQGTVLDNLAWRIRGDHPFAAYQFNPLDNVNPIFSNDASLLLPVNALGRTYRAMTGVGGSPFITIVATTNDTKISITPTAAIEASEANNGIDSIPSIEANETRTFTLQSGHVLNLRATTDPKADLTGTLIEADRSVSVFTGNVATTTSDRCCADHLEQQLPPVTSWGTRYIAARSQPRGAEPDHWVVLAHEDDTVITSSNGLFPPKTLIAGERLRFTTDADFTLDASKPVLLGQFLASSFEVLELGDFCYSDEDCSQSVCSDNTSTGGRCSATCEADRGECAASEVCIDRRLYSQDAGGTCRYQPCGGDLPSCTAGASCISGAKLDVCVEACDGIGATCSNPALIC
ncbi:MAG: IgGFc-binding protein, partial [Myxococcota bacterium]|nr:IgGFc-binding protein [Myxococcota bacterium]